MFGIVVAKGLPAIIPRYVACYSRDIAPVKASNERAEAQVPAGRVVGCLFALIEGVDKDEVHLTRGGRRQFIAHDLPAHNRTSNRGRSASRTCPGSGAPSAGSPP
jgi:hypothetical protein